MKLRILSKQGDALAMMERLAAEVETRWETKPDAETIVLFDNAGLGQAAQILQKTNLVFGAGPLHDSLELNPEFGREIARSNGISTKEVQGPRMSIDGFYLKGQRIGMLLSTVSAEGNAICRIWKKNNPKIYNMTLAKCELFLRHFHYSGPLSCECIIHQHRPHFVRWITHLQAHLLWAIGPYMPVILGIEKMNGQNLPYHWMGVIRVSPQPCYLSAESKNLDTLIKTLREQVKYISVVKKQVVDNLDDLKQTIQQLLKANFL